MDSGFLALIGITCIGIFFILAIFVLPRRKAPEEEGKNATHEIRCSAYWQLKPGLVAGGNLPIARVAFYDSFFVVSLIKPTVILYSEIISVSFKKGWITNSVKFHFSNNRGLVIHPRDVEKIKSLLDGRDSNKKEVGDN